jgi:hypothetical protein
MSILKLKTLFKGILERKPHALLIFPVSTIDASGWEEAWKHLEERVRQGPGLHVLIAIALGYVLWAMLALVVKLCLRLALPILFLFCAFQATLRRKLESFGHGFWLLRIKAARRASLRLMMLRSPVRFSLPMSFAARWWQLVSNCFWRSQLARRKLLENSRMNITLAEVGE